MKKNLLLFLSVAFFISNLSAQNFQGFNTSRYTGIHGVYLNPSSISISKYRWDVNLFSTHVSVQNNNATLSLDDIKDGFDDDKLLEQIAGDGSKPIDALVNLEIFGPSFMFKAGKKSAFAFSSRVRALVGVNDIDGNLLNELADDESSYPVNINVNSLQSAAVNGWAEAGLTYSRHIFSSGNLEMHGGVTLKALGGAVNGYLYSDQFNGILNEDANNGGTYFSQSSGQVGFGFSGLDLDNIEVTDLIDFNNISPGFDIGFNLMIKEDTIGVMSTNYNQVYKWKFGVSVLDIGSVKYQLDPTRSGAYNVNIGANEKFYLDEFDDVEIDMVKEVFDANPQYFSPLASQSSNGSYKVNLPTRLLVDADYHINRNWYVNLAGQFSLVSTTADKPFNTAYYSGITLTPRYDARSFGFWLPMHYNPVTDFNAGFGFRAGPLIMGSGSVISALLGNSKQADFFIGFRFGGLGAKPVKAPKEAPSKE